MGLNAAEIRGWGPTGCWSRGIRKRSLELPHIGLSRRQMTCVGVGRKLPLCLFGSATKARNTYFE